MISSTSIKTAPLASGAGCDTRGLGHNPLGQDEGEERKSGIPAYLTLSPRIRLVTISTVRAARGVDSETVARMVDDATHPRHIRFAFNIGLKPKGSRELRFYIDALIDPAMTRRFSIQTVIEKILGTKNLFTSPEIEIAWTCASTQISRLVKAGLLKAKGDYLTRASLETFLFARWSGNNPT